MHHFVLEQEFISTLFFSVHTLQVYIITLYNHKLYSIILNAFYLQYVCLSINNNMIFIQWGYPQHRSVFQWDPVTSHYITSLPSVLHCTPLHPSALHHAPEHWSQCTALHRVPGHCTAPQCTLHCAPLYCTAP